MSLLRPGSPKADPSVDRLASTAKSNFQRPLSGVAGMAEESLKGMENGVADIESSEAAWLRSAYSITSPRPTQDGSLPIVGVSPSTGKRIESRHIHRNK